MIANLLRLVPESVIWQTVAHRYIAGTSLGDVVSVVRLVNKAGKRAAVSYLGEHATRRAQCTRAFRTYLEVLDEIRRQRLRAYVSIKPTQLGLNLNEGGCLSRATQLLEHARRSSVIVRLDMEGSDCTDRTLALYRSLRERFNNVGIVLQARLKRIVEDAARLAELKADVRVCKGAYREPRSISLRGRGGVRKNFIEILRILLAAGCSVENATHDDVLIDAGEKLILEYGVPRERYHNAVLFGARPDLEARLVRRGCIVVVYIGFGKEWHAYIIRRVQENPALVWTVGKAMVTGMWPLARLKTP